MHSYVHVCGVCLYCVGELCIHTHLCTTCGALHVCVRTYVQLHMYTCLYVAMCLCLRVCSVVCSRCGLLLCGWVVVYTIGTHNVARAHAPHCAAAESDFGLCSSLSLAGLLARMTQKICTYLFNELVCSSFHACFSIIICMHYYIICLYLKALNEMQR